METKSRYFVAGTYTGIGDREIKILENEKDNIYVWGRDIETGDTYYFDRKFLIGSPPERKTKSANHTDEIKQMMDFINDRFVKSSNKDK